MYVIIRLDQALQPEFYRPFMSQLGKNIIISILQIRKLRPREVKRLPRYTQLLEGRAGAELNL